MSKGSLKLVFLFLIIAMETFHGVYLFCLSFSKIPMEKGGMVDSSQCFTNKDCVPFVPFMNCGGAVLFAEMVLVFVNNKSLSSGKVDSSQCFTDKDCISFIPFMKCGGASVFCRDGACVCKQM
ncbi:hypothetical protein ACSQ67_020639 [Phaseolus vulgaris]